MDFDPKEVVHHPTTGLRQVHETPLIAASDESLKGYGCLVETPPSPIEIVRWPVISSRAVVLIGIRTHL
jgi:hypothetical protein